MGKKEKGRLKWEGSGWGNMDRVMGGKKGTGLRMGKRGALRVGKKGKG